MTRSVAATSSTVVVAERIDSEMLARAGLWLALSLLRAKVPRILILVDVNGFAAGDPAVPAPREIEVLIDLIHANGPATVDLAATGDGSRAWAGNRDVHALAELLGYRFETDAGQIYDVVDLAASTTDGQFGEASVLAGTPASSEWLAADFRINLCRLRADEAEGFAAGLANLFWMLPLEDKSLHYRHRREWGAVISELLSRMPPDFTVIAGNPVAQGKAGRRAARAAAKGCVIASANPVLADYAAAMKLGIDPFDSPLLARVARDHPLPARYSFAGPLEPLGEIELPSPLRRCAARGRRKNEFVDGLLVPWLQQRDERLFPASGPLDARASQILTSLAGDGESAFGNAVLFAIDASAAAAAELVLAWQTLTAKDRLVRRVVPLDLDLDRFGPADFEAMTDEQDSLEPVAASAPQRGDGLRWRKVEGAVVFQYVREIGVPFDRFVAAVDVARTIGFMNDYLGGIVIPIERDEAGRPIRQAERNLYLPQPNYLALYGGKPIDVTKIEAARYEEGEHRLYWKTIHSSNGSATADDGMVSFRRTAVGTRIAIFGKQRFVLPPFWQVFDVALIPELEVVLTSHAYQTFFNRTLSNFEALVEGRDVQIGRPADAAVEHPSAVLENRISKLMEYAGPWLKTMSGRSAAAQMGDAAGFVHVVPAA